eukprot:scaffold12.g8273.t1
MSEAQPLAPGQAGGPSVEGPAGKSGRLAHHLVRWLAKTANYAVALGIGSVYGAGIAAYLLGKAILRPWALFRRVDRSGLQLADPVSGLTHERFDVNGPLAPGQAGGPSVEGPAGKSGRLAHHLVRWLAKTANYAVALGIGSVYGAGIAAYLLGKAILRPWALFRRVDRSGLQLADPVSGLTHERFDVNGVSLHVARTGGAASGKPLLLLVHGFPEGWWCWRFQLEVCGSLEGRACVAVMGGRDGESLHVARTGGAASGKPLLLLVHGFPEGWWCWRFQMDALRDVYDVVAVDLRGYGGSSIPQAYSLVLPLLPLLPQGAHNYTTDLLAGDLVALIEALLQQAGQQKLVLAGHDWGGVFSWAAACLRPDLLTHFIVLSAPHPRCFFANMGLRQFLRSWYMFFFQLPWLPEALLRFNDWEALAATFNTQLQPSRRLSTEELERYKQSLAQPGALTGALQLARRRGARAPPAGLLSSGPSAPASETPVLVPRCALHTSHASDASHATPCASYPVLCAAAINYYRAAFRYRTAPHVGRAIRTKLRVPTLVLWADNDVALGPGLLRGTDRYVEDLRIEVVGGNCSHWLQQDRPEAGVQHSPPYWSRFKQVGLGSYTTNEAAAAALNGAILWTSMQEGEPLRETALGFSSVLKNRRLLERLQACANFEDAARAVATWSESNPAAAVAAREAALLRAAELDAVAPEGVSMGESITLQPVFPPGVPRRQVYLGTFLDIHEAALGADVIERWIQLHLPGADGSADRVETQDQLISWFKQQRSAGWGMLARLVARARPGPEPDYWWRQRYWCTLQEASLGAAVVAAAAGIEARFMAAGEARAPAAAAAPPSPRPEPDTRERLVAALRGGLWRAVEACARTGVPPEAELFASLEALCAEVGLTVEEAVQLVDAEAAEGNNPIGQALQPGQRISMERLESPPLVPKTPAGLLSFICFHMILWSCEEANVRRGAGNLVSVDGGGSLHMLDTTHWRLISDAEAAARLPPLHRLCMEARRQRLTYAGRGVLQPCLWHSRLWRRFVWSKDLKKS